MYSSRVKKPQPQRPSFGNSARNIHLDFEKLYQASPVPKVLPHLRHPQSSPPSVIPVKLRPTSLCLQKQAVTMAVTSPVPSAVIRAGVSKVDLAKIGFVSSPPPAHHNPPYPYPRTSLSTRSQLLILAPAPVLHCHSIVASPVPHFVKVSSILPSSR